MSSPTLVRPPELDGLDLTRSVVVEASAGTGKTYLLEHLVLDILIRGRATLDQILVVTFTERATAELCTRIRRKIDQALAISDPADVSGWTLNDAARANLGAARRAFDRATIATIHGFCQRILTEEPLATRRLLGQTQMEGRQVFGQAFRDVLRRRLTTDAGYRPYLEAYLAGGQTVERLETLLFGAASGRGRWKNPFDERALDRALSLLARVDLDASGFDKAAAKLGQARSVRKYLTELKELARVALAGGSRAVLLAHIERNKTLNGYFNKANINPALPELLLPFQEFARAMLAAAPPLEEAVAQRFLPLVTDELARRKLAEGLYDYDDMINGVAEALAGDAGAELVERLRGRYRFALIDEAQDTEPAQWRIFKRVFLDSDAPHPLVLIGDPKQAIYGFRGADVHTYVAACRDIAARGGAPTVALTRNHRSTPEVIAPLNAILEQEAFSPFFDEGEIRYDQPVVATRPSAGARPGITLLRVEPPSDQRKPRIGEIRAALRDAIAEQIGSLRRDEPDLRLSDVAVLTRSNADGRDVAARLRTNGIPSTLFKAEYLFESGEAEDVRAVLAAIADPDDRIARMNAWLTPFFGMDVPGLAAGAEPPRDHPLMARLVAWAALAESRAYARLWPAILNDSGITRRLRLSPGGLRALTNIRHLFDRLQAMASERPMSIADLSDRLAMLGAGHRRSADMDDDTQRVETDADAVRIMTIHAAKGLEAEVVFVYGGLTGRNLWKGCINHLHNGAERLIVAGNPVDESIKAAIAMTRRQEERRLQYVAMTRARRRLVLPFFPVTEFAEPTDREDSDFDAFKDIKGEYRHVNQRLRRLDGDPARRALFETRLVKLDSGASAPSPLNLGETGERASAWQPEADLVALPDRSAGDAAGLRARRRGFPITSYSRLKESAGMTAPDDPGVFEPFEPFDAFTDDGPEATAGEPTDTAPGVGGNVLDPAERIELDDTTAVGAASAVGLPGGAASGLFLHAVLEKVALGPLPALDEWQQKAEVRQLIESELRRWDRQPVHFEVGAALVHAALTVPIDLPAGAPPLEGMARAARVRREVGFLFPLPTVAAAGAWPGADEDHGRMIVEPAGLEGGFVRGFLDVLFEHDGRIWFADWKSDVLSGYTSDLVRARVQSHYDLQVRIYTLATARLLGVKTREDYDRRFGGLVYLFLRGLDGPRGAGLYTERPSYEDLQNWQDSLARLPVSGGGGESGGLA